MNKLSLLLLLQLTAIVVAQTTPPGPPDPLARPAAPAISQAQDGVHNGTTKQERDQHIEPGAPGQTPSAPVLPAPAPR
jgi:hypothetical protein